MVNAVYSPDYLGYICQNCGNVYENEYHAEACCLEKKEEEEEEEEDE